MGCLIFDTETTGKPLNWSVGWDQCDNWPRLVQIAWARGGNELLSVVAIESHIVRPAEGVLIPAGATRIHGISQAQAVECGEDLGEVLAAFCRAVLAADAIVGHNVAFDVSVVCAELVRLGREPYARVLDAKPRRDTMQIATPICKIPGPYGYKWPRLNELHRHLFGGDADDQHTAGGDVWATARCYYELVRLGHITPAASEC